jgi:dienelactone hydrolase
MKFKKSPKMKKMKHYKYLLALIAAFTFAACSSSEKEVEGSNNGDSTNVTDADTNNADTIKIHGTIQFKAADSLPITADSYEILPGEKYILLCHQAGFSRGEYIETAKRLNQLGYNCLAIDQRSGDKCNGIVNQTAFNAKEQELKTDYLDAQQDIEAAINYIYNHCGKKIIVVGSSYSASLVLKIAKASDKISACAVFSPGEYFDGINLQKEITGLSLPIFATSSKEESKDLITLLKGIKDENKTIFVPKAKGDHGSRVLWPDAPDKDEYWSALEAFLKKIETAQ